MDHEPRTASRQLIERGNSPLKDVVFRMADMATVTANMVSASRHQVTQHLQAFDRQRRIARDGRRIIIESEKLRQDKMPSQSASRQTTDHDLCYKFLGLASEFHAAISCCLCARSIGHSGIRRRHRNDCGLLAQRAQLSCD